MLEYFEDDSIDTSLVSEYVTDPVPMNSKSHEQKLTAFSRTRRQEQMNIDKTGASRCQQEKLTCTNGRRPEQKFAAKKKTRLQEHQSLEKFMSNLLHISDLPQRKTVCGKARIFTSAENIQILKNKDKSNINKKRKKRKDVREKKNRMLMKRK